MIRNESIITQDLEHVYKYSYPLMGANFQEFYSYFLSEIPHYDEYWEKYGRKIKRVSRRFFDIISYEPKSLFISFLKNYIDDEFNRYMKLSSRFIDLLRKDQIFNDYFNWLKKYLLYFLKSNYIDHIHGDCLIESDTEVPTKEMIKVKIFLPIEDFDTILDLMELFLLEQESFLNESIEDYYYRKLILQKFKKTYFIFRSMY